MAEQCCGECALWGTKNYGETRSCKAASRVKVNMKKWPSSLTLDRRFTKATDGSNCPCFEPRERGE